jgi:3',5'-cyclic AMP phosphodiesterase CpdA
MQPTRRQVLAAGLSAAAAAGLAACGSNLRTIQPPTPAGAWRRRSLRLAHLTDPHVQPERRSGEGWAACLRHVQSQDDAPSLIVTGGDLIMDGFEQDEARTRTQWDLFTRVLRAECSLPVLHTLGNHDIWGWNRKKSRTTGQEPAWGKRWACDTLGLSAPAYRHDVGGWAIIVLDSVQPDGESGYVGRLDQAQVDWLGKTLKEIRISTPVMVVSHIPIMSVCGLFDRKKLALKLNKSEIMEDGMGLHELFRSARNVRLCLSGHIHDVDRVEADGITYICDGAVSGAWWKGPHGPCVEGYGLVDLYDDGTFEHRYVPYGWKADPA